MGRVSRARQRLINLARQGAEAQARRRQKIQEASIKQEDVDHDQEEYCSSFRCSNDANGTDHEENIVIKIEEPVVNNEAADWSVVRTTEGEIVGSQNDDYYMERNSGVTVKDEVWEDHDHCDYDTEENQNDNNFIFGMLPPLVNKDFKADIAPSLRSGVIGPALQLPASPKMIEYYLEKRGPIMASHKLTKPVNAFASSHCLLCFRKIHNVRMGESQSHQKENTAVNNFQAMFILKKMLSVPNATIAVCLQKVGSAGEWMSYCKSCTKLVKAALKVQGEIEHLEASLRKHQDEMLQKIMLTWKKDEIPQTEMKSIKNTPLWATVRTRKVISVKGPAYATTASSSEIPSRYTVSSSSNSTSTQSIVGESFTSKLDFVSRIDDGEVFGDADFCPDSPSEPSPQHQQYDMANSSEAETREIDELNKDGYRCYLCPDMQEMSLNIFIGRSLKCSECSLYFSSQVELLNSPFIKSSQQPVTNSANARHVCSVDTVATIKYDCKDSTNFNPMWKCGVCSEKFFTDSDRDLHEMNEHSHYSDQPVSSICSKMHECKTCLKSFRNLSEWRLHRALEHPEVAAFSCNFCDISFKFTETGGIEFCDFEEMLNHIRKEHQSLQPNSFFIPKLPDECDFCGAIFNKSSDLNIHMEEKHGLSKNDSYSCSFCNERKHSRQLIQRHISSNHTSHRSSRNSRLVCDICGFKCRETLNFEDHKFVKHGVVPEKVPLLSCEKEECNFQCVGKYKMTQHLMKDHSEERRLKCSFCGKGFLNSSHLKRHEQIHLNTSLKPYQCEICGNSFAVKNYLYIHMRLSHQNRPFASTHKKKPSRKRKVAKSATNINTCTPFVQVSSDTQEIRLEAGCESYSDR